MSIQARVRLLEKALSVTMKMLTPYQPGDSRAVDDWFVACAAIQCDLTGNLEEVEACLDAAMSLPDFVPEPYPQVVFVNGPEDITERTFTNTTRLTLHPPVAHAELEALLEKARNAPPMTEAEWAEQRASMARGLMGD